MRKLKRKLIPSNVATFNKFCFVRRIKGKGGYVCQTEQTACWPHGGACREGSPLTQCYYRIQRSSVFGHSNSESLPFDRRLWCESA